MPRKQIVLPPGTLEAHARLQARLEKELTHAEKAVGQPQIVEREVESGSWAVDVIWDEFAALDHRQRTVMIKEAYESAAPDFAANVVRYEGYTVPEAVALDALPVSVRPVETPTDQATLQRWRESMIEAGMSTIYSDRLEIRCRDEEDANATIKWLESELPDSKSNWATVEIRWS